MIVLEAKDSESWSQWTTEIRRGVLQLLVLSILKKNPSHGYEIVRMLRSSSNGLIDLPGGTIYPLLNRLEKKGLLQEFFWEHEGRKKKTYALTDDGNEVLVKSLEYWRRLITLVNILTNGAETE